MPEGGAHARAGGGRFAVGAAHGRRRATMTDYSEEQRNELEALESIYPDSFTGEARRDTAAGSRCEGVARGPAGRQPPPAPCRPVRLRTATRCELRGVDVVLDSLQEGRPSAPGASGRAPVGRGRCVAVPPRDSPRRGPRSGVAARGGSAGRRLLGETFQKVRPWVRVEESACVWDSFPFW